MYNCAIIIHAEVLASTKRLPVHTIQCSQRKKERKKERKKANVVISSYAGEDIHNEQHRDIKDISLH